MSAKGFYRTVSTRCDASVRDTPDGRKRRANPRLSFAPKCSRSGVRPTQAIREGQDLTHSVCDARYCRHPRARPP